MSDLSGKQLGNYHLLRSIGSGGFADVYLGEHIYLGTPAAVKILQTRLVSDEDRDAFCNEARTIAHLTHQHILRVLDFDVEDNVPFLVTDYAPNGTLRERYPGKKRLALGQVVEYIEQIAGALQYAHNHKVIHRDVKPENILLGVNDEILLSDFGIAIIVQSSSAQLPEKLLGTGAYMAPEQFRGKSYPASDQYALAVMVYEWICGERPFQGTFFDLYEQHQKSVPPPLSEKLSTTPLAVEVALMRALEKQPEARFPSIGEFAKALSQTVYQTNEHGESEREKAEEEIHGSSVFEATIPPEERPNLSLLTETRPSDREYGPQETPAGEIETIAPATLPAFMPASLTQSTEHTVIARPRRSISSLLPTQPVPIRRQSRRRVLRSMLAIGIGAASCAAGIVAEPYIARYIQGFSPAIYSYHGHTDAVWALSWSPDNKRIASASKDTTVQIWDATTGGHELTFRGHIEAVRTVAWSVSGKYLASGANDAIIEVWDARSLVRSVTYLGHSKAVNALAWSSDGQRIASASADQTVQIWKASTNQTTAISSQALINYTGHTGSVNVVAWSPNGRYLASAGDDTTVQVWNANDGKIVYIYNGHTRAIRALAWSPDGQLLATGSDDSSVQVWQALSGRHVNTFTGHSSKINGLAWSSDGQRIVSASDSSPSQTANAAPLQIWDARTGKHVYAYPGQSSSAPAVAWSRDGRTIASAGEDSIVQVWKPE